jgi:superfamily II DNA or RNA helicase
VHAYLSLSTTARGAALISMPTGTGKTAIIAGCISATHIAGKHVLVLAPWSGIVRQLHRDLSRGCGIGSRYRVRPTSQK